MAGDDRASSHPSFWDERYAAQDRLFGTGPSAFVAEEAGRFPPRCDILELGAGEGRTLAWLCAEHGHRGTAVDFSSEALAQADAWAARGDLALNTVQADVRDWSPDRAWDVAIVTFLQLLPSERRALYRRLRKAVHPGGWILGEWFRPAHVTDERFDRIGPSRADRMVALSELKGAFEDDILHRCQAEDVELDEGDFLQGSAGVVRLVAQRSGL